MDLPTKLKITIEHALAIVATHLKIDIAAIDIDFGNDDNGETVGVTISTTSSGYAKLTRRIAKAVGASPETEPDSDDKPATMTN